MWIRNVGSVSALIVTLSVGGGCGDDGDPVQPDATVPFVEAPIGLDAEDGGEIRIENFVFPDGVTRILTTAYFIDEQNGKMAFPNIAMTNVAMCNPRTDHIYPFGDGSDSIGVPASWSPGGRHYMNVGDKITLGATDGSKPSWDMPLYENFITPFMGGSFHNLTYNVPPGADPLLTIDPARLGGQGPDGASGANNTTAKLKVTLPGGADAPATVFDFENGLSGIEIPPRPYDVKNTDGSDAGFAYDGCAFGTPDGSCSTRRKAGDAVLGGANAPIPISKSVDFDKTWTVAATAPADMLTFVAVFGGYGAETAPSVAFLCVTTAKGHITIPKETLATFPNAGILFIAHLLHRTRTLDNHRRIDMVGTSCTSIGFAMTN